MAGVRFQNNAMDTYERARQLAVQGLEGAQFAHAQDNLLSIEDGLEEYEALLPEIDSPPNSLLALTYEFWSGWADCAIHDWRFYEPLEKEDWPRLCGILLESGYGSNR